MISQNKVHDISNEVSHSASLLLNIGRKFLGAMNVADIFYPDRESFEHKLFLHLYLSEINQYEVLIDSNNVIVELKPNA